jgi:FixJ family two-component response regulator
VSNPVIIEVIDDNPDIRRMLGLVLKSHGYEVRLHEDALAFLNVSRTSAPRLLILDVRMPGMTGLELHSRLMAQGENNQVIFMSGECQPHESAVVESSAPVAFLWKPFSTQQLLNAIEKGLQSLH